MNNIDIESIIFSSASPSFSDIQAFMAIMRESGRSTVQDAEYMIRKRYDSDPSSADCFSRLGYFLMNCGIHERALDFFQRDASEKRQKWWGALRHAECMAFCGREIDALNMVESIYGDHPEAVNGYGHIAYNLFKRKRVSALSAAGLADRDLCSGRMSKGFKVIAAQIYAYTEPEKAAQISLEAFAGDKSLSGGLYNVADALRTAGSADEADKMLRTAGLETADFLKDSTGKTEVPVQEDKHVFRHPEPKEFPSEVSFSRDRVFDVLEDLKEFTGLQEEALLELLYRRENLSFMDEWSSTPEILREDHWFYLSSKFYLFANSIHRHAPGCGVLEPSIFRSIVPAGGRVLDYAGGTGNSALSMASMGYITHYRELSALQSAFVRFRRDKYGIGLIVHDWWEELPENYFDFVSFDSIGHVREQDKELRRITRTLKKGGALFLELIDFAVPALFPADDPRRWEYAGNEQNMHIPNQLGDIGKYMSRSGFEWNGIVWIKTV